jgi:polysaccharide biosynthesis/export protein
MRVARSLLVLLAAAVAAAGCARQPVARAPVAAVPAVPVTAPPGIDNLIYGPVTAPAYRPVAAPAPVAGGRGLMMTRLVAAPAPQLAVAPAPAVMVAPAPSVVVAPVAFAPGAEGPYTLDSGDRLRVVVFGQDGLSNSYVVDGSGHIAVPLIGSVLAHGLTTDELSARIAERLRQGFIREPHVTVEIEAYRPFFILGEVTAPGQYPYVANMTVETAIAIAGGFSPRAFRRTVMVNRIVNGQQVQMTVPITCPLRPGDTINVQERWF